MSQIGQYVVVEIVDLDAVAMESEVLTALWVEIPETDDNQTAIHER